MKYTNVLIVLQGYTLTWYKTEKYYMPFPVENDGLFKPKFIKDVSHCEHDEVEDDLQDRLSHEAHLYEDIISKLDLQYTCGFVSFLRYEPHQSAMIEAG